MDELIAEYWFSVPVWRAPLSSITDNDDQEALEYCLNLSKSSAGRSMSNVGGWQSNDFSYGDLVDTPLKKYFDNIHPYASQSLKELGIPHNCVFDNIWINVNGKDHFNLTHHHPRSLIAGVFYLTANNSKIVFQRLNGVDTYWLETYNSVNNTYLSSKTVTYDPVPKCVYLFPGWLPHHVEKNENSNERVSIAFNIKPVF